MNIKILNSIAVIIAALFAVATINAQEAKTMYVMKKGAVIFQHTVSDIDSIIFYEPSIDPTDPLTSDAGVVINGVKWATRNVDKPGAFTATPEDPGMFYQWNSKVGWSAIDPLKPSDGTSVWNNSWNGNNATTWEKANDPCPPGWRMPSQGELNALISSGYVWKTVNSMNGMQFGSGSNTLFLPAAGYRFYDGTLYDAGSDGYYWSSTADDAPYSYYLYFTAGIAYVYWYDYRANGLSCRCVAE